MTSPIGGTGPFDSWSMFPSTSLFGGTGSLGSLLFGLDGTSFVSQLMQTEAQPETLLKTQLAGVQAAAAAYRSVNSAVAALQSAAAALTDPATWGAVQATSSSNTVTASAAAGATPGSLSFTVDQLAAAHTVVTGQNWTSTTDAFGLGSSLTLTKADGTVSTITVGGTGTLGDAIAAINAAGAGVTATAVDTGTGYLLQVGATTTGAAGAFTLTASGGTSGTFSVQTQGQDAQLTVGSGTSAYQVTSSTNTFTGVLPGTTFTVSQASTAATVTVTADPDAAANAVQSLVTAANTVLSKIGGYTDTSPGSTAPLQGDGTLTGLAGQVLDAVTTAIGGGSAAADGLQVTQDGQLTFDPTAFKAALAANPSLVQSTFGGSVGAGADGIAGTADDTVAADGLGARLAVLAAQASDSVTGTLTTMAAGEDRIAGDVQSQIDQWDAVLQERQQTLTQQFTDMTEALGMLNSQSSWLRTAVGSLPTSGGVTAGSTKPATSG